MTFDRDTLPFWCNRRMIFAEVGKGMHIYDPTLFFKIATQLASSCMSADELTDNLSGFRSILNSNFLVEQNRPKYDKIAGLVLTAIQNGHPHLGPRTPYEYVGSKDVHEVLEDVLRVLNGNGNQMWATAIPIPRKAPFLKITIEIVEQQNWLEQKFHLEPNRIAKTVLCTDDLISLAGTSEFCRLRFPSSELHLHCRGFSWHET